MRISTTSASIGGSMGGKCKSPNFSDRSARLTNVSRLLFRQRYDFRDRRVAIHHRDGVTFAHVAKVIAQLGFQLADLDFTLHD
jgi:hypothetical protein